MPVTSTRNGNTMTLGFVDLERASQDFASYAAQADQAAWAMGEIVDRIHQAIHASEGIRRAFAREGISLPAFARKLGLSPARLRALRLTAAAFPPKERQAGLSWAHHHLVARALGADGVQTRRRWLKEAAKHRWGLGELARRLKRGEGLDPEAKVRRLRKRLAEAEAALARLRDEKGLAKGRGGCYDSGAE